MPRRWKGRNSSHDDFDMRDLSEARRVERMRVDLSPMPATNCGRRRILAWIYRDAQGPARETR